MTSTCVFIKVFIPYKCILTSYIFPNLSVHQSIQKGSQSHPRISSFSSFETDLIKKTSSSSFIPAKRISQYGSQKAAALFDTEKFQKISICAFTRTSLSDFGGKRIKISFVLSLPTYIFCCMPCYKKSLSAQSLERMPQQKENELHTSQILLLPSFYFLCKVWIRFQFIFILINLHQPVFLQCESTCFLWQISLMTLGKKLTFNCNCKIHNDCYYYRYQHPGAFSLKTMQQLITSKAGNAHNSRGSCRLYKIITSGRYSKILLIE